MTGRADASLLTEAEVRERIAWASRRGQPHWLWPELDPADWKAALASIERAVRDVLAGGPAPRLAGRAEAIGLAGYTSGMGPLLGYWLRAGLIAADPEAAALLGLHLAHNGLRMERMERRAMELAAGFAARGIGHAALKGMDTAFAYFPEPGTRPMADIDLLVDARDRAAAGEVLAGLGYAPGREVPMPPAQTWRRPGTPELPRTLRFVHADDPWSVDLQTSLNRRHRAGAPVVELDRVARFEEAAAQPLTRRLAPVSLVLHLACHASCDARSLTLLRLVELLLVIRHEREAGRLGWDELLAMASEAGALGGVYPALNLCERLAIGTIPAEVLTASRRAAPAAVHRVIERLSPAHAQDLLRCSLEERFMWSPSPARKLGQALREVFPPGSSSPAVLFDILHTRAWRLARGTLTR